MTRKVRDYWISFFNLALDFVYPPKCALCGLFSECNPCVQCLGEMEPLLPIFAYQGDGELDYRGCLYRYPGRAGQAVRRLKYQRSTSLAKYMASALAEAVQREGLEYDIAAPVPIHWFRLTSRGFNQAELLSAQIPKHGPALRRTRATRPQAGLTTAERLTNLEGAFEVTCPVSGKRVLLVDDVVTSGRTAKECAKALKAAGALEVGVLAFCGEPLLGVSDIEAYAPD